MIQLKYNQVKINQITQQVKKWRPEVGSRRTSGWASGRKQVLVSPIHDCTRLVDNEQRQNLIHWI